MKRIIICQTYSIRCHKILFVHQQRIFVSHFVKILRMLAFSLVLEYSGFFGTICIYNVLQVK
jgi:hypothetical protein